MKAIKIIDNKLNWVDADYPVCMDHEVIIKIKSTAVNRADLAQKAGLYPAPREQVKFLDLNVVELFMKLEGMLLIDK